MTSPASRDWRVILAGGRRGSRGIAVPEPGGGNDRVHALGTVAAPYDRTSGRSEDVTASLRARGWHGPDSRRAHHHLLAARQSLRGRADPSYESKPMRWWVVLSWMGVWLGASGLAQFLHDSEHSRGRSHCSISWPSPVPSTCLVRLAIGGHLGRLEAAACGDP